MAAPDQLTDEAHRTCDARPDTANKLPTTKGTAECPRQPTPRGARRLSAQRDRVARALLIVAAFGAAIATVGAIGTASDADAATRVVETWRLLGLSVFTGLFVLLAYRPRYYAGVWQLAIANKFALAAFGIAYGANATDARQILAFDGAIAILLVAAYVLSRAWRAWSSVRIASSSTAP